MKDLEKNISAFLMRTIEQRTTDKGQSGPALSEDTNLFTTAVLNSLELLEVIDAVEREFELEVDFSDSDPATFATVRGLAQTCAAASPRQ